MEFILLKTCSRLWSTTKQSSLKDSCLGLANLNIEWWTLPFTASKNMFFSFQDAAWLGSTQLEIHWETSWSAIFGGIHLPCLYSRLHPIIYQPIRFSCILIAPSISVTLLGQFNPLMQTKKTMKILLYSPYDHHTRSSCFLFTVLNKQKILPHYPYILSYYGVL